MSRYEALREDAVTSISENLDAATAYAENAASAELLHRLFTTPRRDKDAVVAAVDALYADFLAYIERDLHDQVENLTHWYMKESA